MCRLAIVIDRSVHTFAPLFELVEQSRFHLRSIRVAPVAYSQKADLYLSLGGGSKAEFDTLLGELRKLPAVLSMQHSVPFHWVSRSSEVQERSSQSSRERVAEEEGFES